MGKISRKVVYSKVIGLENENFFKCQVPTYLEKLQRHAIKFSISLKCVCEGFFVNMSRIICHEEINFLKIIDDKSRQHAHIFGSYRFFVKMHRIQRVK